MLLWVVVALVEAVGDEDSLERLVIAREVAIVGPDDDLDLGCVTTSASGFVN